MSQNTIEQGVHPAIYSCMEQCLEFQKEDFSRFLQNLKNCRYVLGIDMSSHLVSVGYASLYAEGLRHLMLVHKSYGTGQRDTYEGEKQERPFSKLAVGYRHDGSYEIGYDAFRCDTVVQDFIQPLTKQALSEPVLSLPKATKHGGKVWKTRRCVWIDFVQRLLEQIQKAISGKVFFGEKENTLLAIIPPSGDDWNLFAEEYKKVICEATGYEPWQVIIFPRNRAIVECACQLSNEQVSSRDGLLVLDVEYPSFRTFYLPSEGPSAVECAIPVGGQTVDKILAHYFLRQWFPFEMGAYIQPDSIPESSFFGKKHRIFECTLFEFMEKIHTFRERLCAVAMRGKPEYRCSFQIGRLPSIEFSASMLEGLLQTEKVSAQLPLYMMPCNGTQVQKDTWFGFLEKAVTCRINGLGCMPLKHIVIAGDSGNLIGIETCIRQGMLKSNCREDKWYGSLLEKRLLCVEQDWPLFVGAFFQLHRFIKFQEVLCQFPIKLDITLQNELLPVVADRITDRLYTVAEIIVKKAASNWYELPSEARNYTPTGLLPVTKSAMQNMSLWNIENGIFDALSDLQKELESLYNRQDMTASTLLFTTERCIRNFLNEIGVHDVNRIMDLNMKSISLSCSPDELQNKVTDTICNSIDDFFHSGVFCGEVAAFSISPFQARKSILQSFLSLISYYIKRNLKKMILEELKSSYKANNGFGFANQILKKLVPSINTALRLC